MASFSDAKKAYIVEQAGDLDDGLGWGGKTVARPNKHRGARHFVLRSLDFCEGLSEARFVFACYVGKMRMQVRA